MAETIDLETFFFLELAVPGAAQKNETEFLNTESVHLSRALLHLHVSFTVLEV